MSDTSITERELPAEPERVWEHLVDPERLGRWLGGDITLDDPDRRTLRPGDEGTIRFPADDEASVLLVEEVDEAERLAFRWASPSLPPTEVVIELRPTETGSRVRIVERMLPAGTPSRHAATARATACV